MNCNNNYSAFYYLSLLVILFGHPKNKVYGSEGSCGSLHERLVPEDELCDAAEPVAEKRFKYEIVSDENPYTSICGVPLKKVRIQGNGNCLPRSLAYSLFSGNDRGHHRLVRRIIVEYLRNHRSNMVHSNEVLADELFHQMGSKNKEKLGRLRKIETADDLESTKKQDAIFDLLMEVLATDGVWMGEESISAAAKAFNVNITVVEKTYGQEGWHGTYPALTPKTAATIYMQRVDRNHWNALIPLIKVWHFPSSIPY